MIPLSLFLTMGYAKDDPKYDGSEPVTEAGGSTRAENFCMLCVYGNGGLGIPAAEAYVQAGYDGNPENRHALAAQIKYNPKIKKRIKFLLNEKKTSLETESFELHDRMRRVVSLNLFDYMEIVDESVILKKELPEDVAWMVQQIKPGKYGAEIQFISKEWAAKLISEIENGNQAGNKMKIPDTLRLEVVKPKK